ncbi:carbon starvation CstA family protein [Escherichia coli]
MVASVSVYLVAYRYYSLYIAQKVMKARPHARRLRLLTTTVNDVPTNRYVLFGHHFAAIAGAGPLVGPVLAATDGLPAWHAVAAGGGSAGRCGTGLYGAVYLLSP